MILIGLYPIVVTDEATTARSVWLASKLSMARLRSNVTQARLISIISSNIGK
jgi:hypothetical protein